MKNPFKSKEKFLETGFYWDSYYNKIIFLYKDPIEKQISIYDRYFKGEDLSFIFSKSSTFHLKSLPILFNLSDKQYDEVKKDFEWIHSNKELEKVFKEFLLKKEYYEILSIYEKSIKNNLLKNKYENKSYRW